MASATSSAWASEPAGSARSWSTTPSTSGSSASRQSLRIKRVLPRTPGVSLMRMRTNRDGSGTPPELADKARVAGAAGRVVEAEADDPRRRGDAGLAVAADRRARIEAGPAAGHRVAEDAAGRDLEAVDVDVEARRCQKMLR